MSIRGTISRATEGIRAKVLGANINGMTPEEYYRQQTDPDLFVSHNGSEYGGAADPFVPVYDYALDQAAEREQLAVYGTTRTPAEPGAEGSITRADPWAEPELTGAQIDAMQAAQEAEWEAAREDPESYSDFWAILDQPTPTNYLETLSERPPYDAKAASDEYGWLSDEARLRYMGDRAAELAGGNEAYSWHVGARMLRDGATADDMRQVTETAREWAATMQARPSEPEALEQARQRLSDPDKGDQYGWYPGVVADEKRVQAAEADPEELEPGTDPENADQAAINAEPVSENEQAEQDHENGRISDEEYYQRRGDVPKVIKAEVEPPDAGYMAAPVAQKEAAS